jgi:hypothetical protein
MPPTVALPSDASESGNRRPAAAAASCAASTVQPASTVIALSSGSTRRTARMRSSETTTSVPESSGVEAPTRPVLPPWGTIGAPTAAQAATTRATSAVEPGRTTQRARPG